MNKIENVLIAHLSQKLSILALAPRNGFTPIVKFALSKSKGLRELNNYDANFE